jgi:hypothetical protein
MSWKSWLLRIGSDIGAVATGQPEIAVLGNSIASGMDNKSAIDKTSAAQQAAVTEARNAQNQATAQSSAAYQPYMNLGAQGADALGGLLGFAPSGGGKPAVPAPTTGPIPLAPGEPYRPTSLPSTLREMGPTSVPTGNVAQARQTVNQSSYQPPQGHQAVKAPNGQVYFVPSNDIQRAIQAGGQVVS